MSWENFIKYYLNIDELDFALDISRIDFGDNFFCEMEPKIQSAFLAMADLEAGAIANPDEGRMVGHYWLRTPELAPSSELQQHISREIDLIAAFGRDVVNGTIKAPNGEAFTDVLWIGIGGSGLGPALMIKALQNPGEGLPFHFFDNVDPNGMSNVLAGLEGRLDRTLVVTVSKSGGTPEPHLGMEQARHRLEAADGQWAGQAVAVTMLDSMLDKQAQKEGWLKRFDMFD